MYRYLFVILLLVSNSGIAIAKSTGDFEKECSQESLVFNKKGEQVGTKIGGVCAGYLLGALDVLSVVDKELCVSKGVKPTPEYLLSVYRAYVKDKGHEKNAEETIIKAYKRAYGC